MNYSGSTIGCAKRVGKGIIRGTNSIFSMQKNIVNVESELNLTKRVTFYFLFGPSEIILSNKVIS